MREDIHQLIKTINKLDAKTKVSTNVIQNLRKIISESLEVGDKVITIDHNIGTIVSIDDAGTYIIEKPNGNKLDYFEDELQPYLGKPSRMWAKITYDGVEVNSYAIERFIGEVIPENFDKSKFNLEIEVF